MRIEDKIKSLIDLMKFFKCVRLLMIIWVGKQLKSLFLLINKILISLLIGYWLINKYSRIQIYDVFPCLGNVVIFVFRVLLYEFT